MSVRSLLGGIVAQDRSPVPYTTKFRQVLTGLSSWRDAYGRKGELEMYGENGTLYGIVSRLAATTSLVEWHLYRSAPSGLKEDREEITTPHPARTVWNRPNLWMAGQEFREVQQQHVELTGESWWVLETSRLVGGAPVGMWPVRPDRMWPVPSPTDFVVGYIYLSPDGEEVPLRRQDVLMLRTPAPLDIYRGQSPLPALARDLANDRAQGEWSNAFFRNAAMPGGIIKVDRRMQDDEFDEMVTRWNLQHRGVTNAGRVAILEQAEFETVAYSQKDMQFVEGRGWTKQALLDAYGFPKFGLGDVDDVNRASAEASLALYAQMLSVPRLTRIKNILNFRFLPLFGPLGKGVEFDFDNPVPPDREMENDTLTAKVTALTALVDAGFDADEACDAVDLPRMTYSRPEPPAPRVLPGGGGPDGELVPA